MKDLKIWDTKKIFTWWHKTIVYKQAFVYGLVWFVALRLSQQLWICLDGMVSSPNHTFFLAKLEQAVNQFFVHIHSLETDNNPLEWNSGREENDHRNYLMITLHKSMGPGWD